MDLFFMKRPQYAINGMDQPTEEKQPERIGDYIPGIITFGDPTKITVSETKDDDLDDDYYNSNSRNSKDEDEEDEE